MGKPSIPEKVKLFTGIITREEHVNSLNTILKPLGEIEDLSPILEFDEFSQYYSKEMGSGLKRLWVSFRGTIDPESIVDLKLISNEIEHKYSVEGKRTINIDPGYVSLTNLVLVTTKNYSHRIYLGKGIYGEVTLIYRKKEGFVPLQWTYPDYRTPVALDFFNKVRTKLFEELRYRTA